jgi:flavin reductase (DIM6/NTAB) family NADH-FMN oxidoreductase RutF
MKVKIEKEKITRLVNCGMVILVTSAYKDKATITPCAWHMPLSKKPPAIGVALAKKHFSSELIKKSEAFIINVPPFSLIDKLILCGSFSGRERDKFKEVNLTPQKGNYFIRIPKIKECIGHLECSLFDIKEVGDHYLFFGEVVYAEAEEEFFKEGFWNTQKIDLIFHLGGYFFFKSSPFKELRK